MWWNHSRFLAQERLVKFLNTLNLAQHNILTPERYAQFIERKRQEKLRFESSLRCQPYEHRPWDRGYNPYEGVA